MGTSVVMLVVALSPVITGPDESNPTWNQVLGGAAVALTVSAAAGFVPLSRHLRRRQA